MKNLTIKDMNDENHLKAVKIATEMNLSYLSTNIIIDIIYL